MDGPSTAVGRGLGASTSSSSSNTPSTIKLVYPDEIQANLEFLARAADTQAEDPDAVYEALSTLERQMRTFAKSDSTVALNLQDQLTGDWRLIFTTGTKQTQERRGGARINYFPIKAIQSFDTTVQPNTIENGIYVGQFPLLQFRGTMEFDLRKCRLEFDFDFLELVGFIGLNLKKGQAASLGSQSGLGSESNVANAAKDKSAFFNWISADQKIATARGGGGGLALWKRVDSSAFD
eukprot:CAMPEP_0172444046 /NCGR_PEP_ID=MMETSP1065-20121228/4184_1 /TAXON_ID=265537 /ORGANISM="Amphiprora paludosa, Strain CCMP125" /LENGTH=235 /DNA_ID=CAMNT_0013194463 /DNA_START=73 /DNA_END=781 /DNA_ORIENTATION=+